METDAEMTEILESLLRDDLEITARAVARLHPRLSAASSITRSESRKALLAHFQLRQKEYRKWRSRAGKKSTADLADALAIREQRIAELESHVQTLTTSHVALLRAVGALGGFSKWAQFFQDYKQVRETLGELKAIPANIAVLQVGQLTTRGTSKRKIK